MGELLEQNAWNKVFKDTDSDIKKIFVYHAEYLTEEKDYSILNDFIKEKMKDDVELSIVDVWYGDEESGDTRDCLRFNFKINEAGINCCTAWYLDYKEDEWVFVGDVPFFQSGFGTDDFGKVINDGCDIFTGSSEDGFKPLSKALYDCKIQIEHQNEYSLLSRLMSDCDYFLASANGDEKVLWAGNVRDQIDKMKELYETLPIKPEWVEMEDIEDYEKALTEYAKEKAERKAEKNSLE